jgi:hypothetical protein
MDQVVGYLPINWKALSSNTSTAKKRKKKKNKHDSSLEGPLLACSKGNEAIITFCFRSISAIHLSPHQGFQVTCHSWLAKAFTEG